MESYDRNDNFGASTSEAPDWNMSLPEKNLYKDIHSGSTVPRLLLSTVDTYLSHYNAPLQQKAKDLYKDRFLQYIRHVTADETTFIHGKCHAEMKKGMSYYIDISLDKYGIIRECQCDCAAGQGPEAHCKHVQTALWALVCHSTTGGVETEETCTQRLQTFHHTKKLTGSPAKSQNLELGTEGDFDFDPRPPKYINEKGYPDFVKNLVANFPHSDPMPIDGIIEPANTYAATADHPYSVYNPEEEFLKNNNISSITPAEIEKIEISTRKQAKSKTWIDERCKRLTSSNFGRICNATSATDFPKLALSLTKFTNAKSASIKHGHQYESVAAAKFENDKGLTTSPCGMFVSSSHPYLAASPDRLLNEDCVIEVKCPYTARDKDITEINVPWLQLHGNELTLDRSHSYFFQIQGQLFCTKRRKCILVVYTFKDTKYISIEKDDEFITQMIDKLTGFYEKHFQQAVLSRFFHKNYYRYNFQPTSIF